MSKFDYAGDKMPGEVWGILTSDPRALLVDVRTKAEWDWVGWPDLSGLGREPLFLSWQSEAGQPPDPDFASTLATAVPDRETPIFFLCRSGARSRDAAIAVTALGYTCCYNVATGFEGAKNDAGRRGTVAGWKVGGFPWFQN